MTSQGENQADGELRHADAVGAWRVHDDDPPGAGGRDVDVVDAGAGTSDHSQLRRTRDDGSRDLGGTTNHERFGGTQIGDELLGRTTRPGVDYVRYTSTRLNQSYLAWQLDPTQSSITQHSISYQMVAEAANDSTILQALQVYRGDFGGSPLSNGNFTGPFAGLPAQLTAIGYTIPATAANVDSEITRLYDRINNLESFFNYLIQLERQYGIAFPAIYQRAPLGE